MLAGTSAHLSNSAQSVNGVVSARKVRQLTAESALTTIENARSQPSIENWSTRLLLKSIDIAKNGIPDNKKLSALPTFLELHGKVSRHLIRSPALSQLARLDQQL